MSRDREYSRAMSSSAGDVSSMKLKSVCFFSCPISLSCALTSLYFYYLLPSGHFVDFFLPLWGSREPFNLPKTKWCTFQWLDWLMCNVPLLLCFPNFSWSLRIILGGGAQIRVINRLRSHWICWPRAVWSLVVLKLTLSFLIHLIVRLNFGYLASSYSSSSQSCGGSGCNLKAHF